MPTNFRKLVSPTTSSPRSLRQQLLSGFLAFGEMEWDEMELEISNCTVLSRQFFECLTNLHLRDPLVFDLRGVNFDDYDEDYADDRSETEPPSPLFFKMLKNYEIRQKVEEWGKRVLP